jgi:FecR protein/Putative zinc-finger
MSEKHYKKELSAYLNDELSPDKKQNIVEHLSRCADCRTEFDEIRKGAAFANHLQRIDAPESLWNEIEKELDDKRKRKKVSLYSKLQFLRTPVFVFAPSLFVLIFGFLYFVVYKSSFNSQSNESAANTAQNSDLQDESPPKTPTAWNVEILSGGPKLQSLTGKNILQIGEILETDANSRARLEVANIGDVEIEPNSRVKLINTNQNEHRLLLEHGVLKASIIAPPRLFIVDTPSAAAVDLGCEYTLEVDKEGNNKLHVTSGYVSLERDNFESIVPAGAICLTKKGKGLGTPVFYDASLEFQKAVYSFDFENGGSTALQIILSRADPPDSLTLWHLLSRVPESEREKVFNKLVSFVKLPEGATKKGILELDRTMLEAWRIKMEELWFEGAE